MEKAAVCALKQWIQVAPSTTDLWIFLRIKKKNPKVFGGIWNLEWYLHLIRLMCIYVYIFVYILIFHLYMLVTVCSTWFFWEIRSTPWVDRLSNRFMALRHDTPNDEKIDPFQLQCFLWKNDGYEKGIFCGLYGLWAPSVRGKPGFLKLSLQSSNLFVDKIQSCRCFPRPIGESPKRRCVWAVRRGVMADEDDAWVEKMMGSRWFHVRRCCLKFETKPKIGKLISDILKCEYDTSIVIWKKRGTCTSTWWEFRIYLIFNDVS